MNKISNITVHYDNGGLTTVGADQVCISAVCRIDESPANISLVKSKVASFELTAREFSIVREILNTIKTQSKTSVADLLAVFKQMDHYQNDVEELVRKMNKIEL
jgi:hypothetical protein